MASQVEICNAALILVGSERIVSITDDSEQARILNALWDMQRDAELSSHPWTFAITRTELPALADAPLFGWGKAYQLPSDYLAMVEVGEDWVMYLPNESGPLFAIEGSKILCDESAPLRIRYVKRVTNTGAFPPLFAEAFACRLAAKITERRTADLSKRRAAWAEYAEAIRTARRRNAIEQPPQRIADDSWTLAMRGQAG